MTVLPLNFVFCLSASEIFHVFRDYFGGFGLSCMVLSFLDITDILLCFICLIPYNVWFYQRNA